MDAKISEGIVIMEKIAKNGLDRTLENQRRQIERRHNSNAPSRETQRSVGVTEEDQQSANLSSLHSACSSTLPDEFGSGNGCLQFVFETFRSSVLVVTPELKIVWNNNAADKMLGAGDILRNCKGILRAVDTVETASLRKFVTDTLDPNDRCKHIEVLTIRCRETARYCEIVCCPVPGDLRPPSNCTSTVGFLFVSDPLLEATLSPSLLKSIFGLTECESRLAVALLNGVCVEQYAGESHISQNTARTHLKSIFRKTDTASQANLVSLLSRLVPIVDVDHDTNWGTDHD